MKILSLANRVAVRAGSIFLPGFQGIAGVFTLCLVTDMALAEILTTTTDVRTLSGVNATNNYATNTYLSLYNSSAANLQRTWLNFDLSSYAGKTISSDVTLTLVADTAYGARLTNAALGAADAAWQLTGITWNNQPNLTIVSNATCPTGDFSNGGSVNWLIPAAVVQNWVDHGYHGIGLISGTGSTLHFKSSRSGGTPTLRFSIAGGPTAGGVASPATLAPGQSTLITVMVTNGVNPTIGNVTLDASQIGVTLPVSLMAAGGNVFTNTVTVGAGTVYGDQTLVATVTDGAGLQGQAAIPVFLPNPAAHKAPSSSLNAWQSNRFGLFIHWGPVTLTGLEISWSRANSNPQCPNKGPTPVATYDNLYTQFNPTNFNASNWVAIARAAGMKYLVLTAKHCDGFLLWDSKASDYNIMNSPFHRDVCGELADAAHAAGMGLGWYFSPMDWKDPRFRNAQNADFIKTMQAELRELLSNYGKIDLLWFDTDGYSNVYDVTNTYAMCRSLQPDMVIDNRLDMGSMAAYNAQAIGPWADYYTPEQRIGGFDNLRPWETCMTLGTQWAWKPNDTIKPLQTCLNTLLLCAGGDGNLLFNLGPQSTGAFEQRYTDTIAGMGTWLARNGESVYGTRGGPYKPGGNFSSTRKDDAVYLHLLPPQTYVTLPGMPANILSATVLTGGGVTFTQTTNSVVLRLSPDAITNPVATVKLTLAGSVTNLPVLAAGVLSSFPITNTWQLPQNITSSSEVSTQGVPVIARQATGDSGGNADQTVNGVTFSGTANAQNGVTCAVTGNTGYNATAFISAKTLSGVDAAAYQKMLAGAWYGNTSPITLGLNGLTPGHRYLIQIWANDFRSITNVRTETVMAAAGADINVPTLHYMSGDGVSAGSGTGQFVIGTFAAIGTSATFCLTGNDSSQLNAFQLRDLTALNPTNITASVSGTNLSLSWPADHIGWRLLVQTNKLSMGISSNINDWAEVSGSSGTNQLVRPLKWGETDEFYRLVR